MAEVYKRVAEACDSLGEVDLSGITLESADPRLLDVSQMDLDAHVSMQPSAMAYYGALVKDASRRLAVMKRHFDRWKTKKLAEARVAVMNSASAPSKILAADIEARFIVDNESEIESKEAQLDKLQMEYDVLSVWLEAWRQKSFSIREHANITEDERWNSSSSMKEENALPRAKLDKVRSIIRKRQEASAS